MRRGTAWSTALAWAVAGVVALGGAACARDDRYLLPGDYAGSTSGDRIVQVKIAEEPKVNGVKAKWGTERGELVVSGAKGKERMVLKCAMQAKGEEMRCTVPRPAELGGGFETVELMQE